MLVASGVVPVAFAVTNNGQAPFLVERVDFRLRIDDRIGIEPALPLPGRAASLLRDTSDSRAAALVGYLVLGVLAVPAIVAAEDQEVVGNAAKREGIFSEVEVAPGETGVGYLIF